MGLKLTIRKVLLSDAYVKTIRKLEEPSLGNELMRFLGLINYFFRFLNHHAEWARPLYDVLTGIEFSKKRCRVKWLVITDRVKHCETKQKDSWKLLKEGLSNTGILSPLRCLDPKKVMTYVSAYELGGILLQQSEKGLLDPVRLLTDN